jgi:hypothetical protein
MITGLTVKNFRCFTDDLERLPLRPLTLLVGENSTGKSSFLAAIRLAWDIGNTARRIDFNEEPFLLGAFDQISNFRGGRAGRADTFEISFEAPIRRRRRVSAELPEELSLCHGAEFHRAGSHPAIIRQYLRYGDYSFAATFPTEPGAPTFEIQTRERKTTHTFDEEPFRFRSTAEAPVDWMYMLHASGLRGQGRLVEESKFSKEETAQIEDILMNARFGTVGRPIAIAPVRTRPQRTYNPVSETPLPEGEHVPMVLAKTYFEKGNRWESLKSALDQFGVASGLFSSLDIKPLGRHESEPFQIRVRIDGPPSNLVDVGYGVSQVLPILVDSILADKGNLFLLQQPEIHLHPRAQAELGTFLARIVSTQSIQLVIETHSDYLLDRIRMDVRDGRVLPSEDIVILFFERNSWGVSIRPMSIDKNGNIVNVPTSYRRFFLDEERRFLGSS